MRDSRLSDPVRHLILTSVPNVDALEILITLAEEPERSWALEEITSAIRAGIRPQELRQYLDQFAQDGLIRTNPDQTIHVHPSTPQLGKALQGLRQAYNERPVTLIRTVYELADQRAMQSFADAFRLRKDS